ncbi:hypothetical protein BOTBODRAFT_57822 [Botryobasidium botryosum FD-172 SS1]|uniref:Uncharacterized protein n=1 Tax=Botryobasidium botryosum (strain FD-172 SS1) TaxID=930990 RepID=A0A067M5C4_BOTB1|nr:hypothetical protein BOTBODRAFT_57822 [Botryobasidium botryosum FD-172 SS1]
MNVRTTIRTASTNKILIDERSGRPAPASAADSSSSSSSLSSPSPSTHDLIPMSSPDEMMIMSKSFQGDVGTLIKRTAASESFSAFYCPTLRTPYELGIFDDMRAAHPALEISGLNSVGLIGRPCHDTLIRSIAHLGVKCLAGIVEVECRW